MTDPIANSLEVVAEIEARQKKRINLVDKICNSPSVDGRAKLPAMPSWNQQECLDDCDTLLAHIDTLQRELEAANECVKEIQLQYNAEFEKRAIADEDNTALKVELEAMTDPIANALEVIAEIRARHKLRASILSEQKVSDWRSKALDDETTLLTHIDTLQRELEAANEWIATSVKEAHFSGSVNLDLDAENTELKAEIEKLKAIKMGPDTPVSCSHNWEYTTGGWVCAMCGMTLPFMDTSITAK